ncbi:MAG: LTA synthase family protein [Clostridium sp.]
MIKKTNCYTMALFLLFLYVLQIFMPVSVKVSIPAGEQNVLRMRWDNCEDGYPFIGEDVYKNVKLKHSNEDAFFIVSIPVKSQQKLRFDLKPADKETVLVQVSNIAINSLFHSKIIDADDINSCFSGFNGAEVNLNDDMVEFTAQNSEDPYVQTLERAEGEENWFYFYRALIFYIVLAFLISVFVEKLKNILKKCYPKIRGVIILACEKLKLQQVFPVVLFYSYCFIWSILIEAVSRKSLSLSLIFIKEKPAIFLCNYAFVCLWYTVGFVVVHKLTYFIVSSAIPLAFLTSNYFLLKMRGTPLVWQDLSAMQFGIAIFFDTYSKDIVIITIIVTGILLCLFLGLSYRKKSKNRRVKVCIGNSIFSLAIIIGIYGQINSSFEAWNQSEIYLKNGLILNFFDSYLKSKVKIPSGYSMEGMENIKEELTGEHYVTSTDPNIIILQIEAFMDPLTIPGLKYSQDPIPNMRKLMDEYSSGNLQVNVFGGSTVNSEFEVLTGLPTKYLGTGDYPYLTKITYEPMESMTHYLSDRYQTTAIHNWYGDFYNRDKVFPNLGFERFISKENIVDGTYDKYYMDDSCFEEYIPRVLKESKERDFIYGITVQMHGPYSTTKPDAATINVTGNYKPEILNNIEQYVNTLNKVDTVIGHLIEYFDATDEPIVFFAFGDHQPALDILNDTDFVKSYPEYDKYTVPYICYNNYNNGAVNVDMAAYQVSSYLLDLCGKSGGIISDFHHKYKETKEYDEKLELIQYDIISGKQYLYDKNNPYKNENMVYGFDSMLIDEVESEENSSYIYGENFTPSCKAAVNGNAVTLEYINSGKIAINKLLEPGEELEVYQKGLYRKIGESVFFSVN